MVRTPEGTILLDPGGKKSGRGVYLCYAVLPGKSPEIISAKPRSQTAKDEVYARLEQELGETPHE